MIKIAHESPISIFDRVQEWTDYDYALVHLFEESDEYYNCFVKALNTGREVILDNSVFELGTAFNDDRYAYWIDRLHPTWYIIPDDLENRHQTLENAYKWEFKYGDSLPGKRVAVAQGHSYFELVECYLEFANDPYIDMVGISFDYSFFEDWYPNAPTKYHRWMLGRIELLDRLTRDRVVNSHKPHHLLGCGLPQEGALGKYHMRYPWIYSMDTSNPVVHGMKYITFSDTGLQDKELVKLYTLIKEDVGDCQLACVKWNIDRFRDFWNKS